LNPTKLEIVLPRKFDKLQSTAPKIEVMLWDIVQTITYRKVIIFRDFSIDVGIVSDSNLAKSLQQHLSLYRGYVAPL
jgi:hypothetical protein